MSSKTTDCFHLTLLGINYFLEKKHMYSRGELLYFCNVFGFLTPQVKLNSLKLVLWWKQWHPTPVLLPGKSHGQRSLEGCSPWGCKESDMTEWLHFHFSLSCIGEGNGNPFQCSCLKNPRDGRAWWAAVYGAAQSRTRLKQLSEINYSEGTCLAV